jgi:hypothetical protein
MPLWGNLVATNQAVFMCEIYYTMRDLFDCVQTVVKQQCSQQAISSMVSLQMRLKVGQYVAGP